MVSYTLSGVVAVVVVVVGDSNRWGDVSELYKDTNYGSLLLVNWPSCFLHYQEHKNTRCYCNPCY
jgi:hypothetical protein